MPPCCAHQPSGAGHRLPLPIGCWVSHLWRGTQLSGNPGRVLLLIHILILIFLILVLPNRGLLQLGMLHQSKALLAQHSQVHARSPEWIYFLWRKLLKWLLSSQQESSLKMIWKSAYAKIVSLPFDQKICVSDLCRNRKPVLSPITNLESIHIEEHSGFLEMWEAGSGRPTDNFKIPANITLGIKSWFGGVKIHLHQWSCLI